MDQRRLLRAGALVSLALICVGVVAVPLGMKRWIDFTFANGVLICLAAQTVLVACWFVLGPFGKFIRFTIAPVWMALIWLSGYQLAIKIPLFSEPGHAIQTASLVLGIHLVESLIVITFNYAAFGWQAHFAWDGSLPNRSARQFNLRDAFVILSALSLLFAVSRNTFPNTLQSTFQVEKFVRHTVISLSIFGGLMGPLVGLTVLRPSWRSIWLVPLFILVTLAQTVVLGLLNDELSTSLPAFELIYILADNVAWNLLQLTPVIGAFLLIRLGGVSIQPTRAKGLATNS